MKIWEVRDILYMDDVKVMANMDNREPITIRFDDKEITTTWPLTIVSRLFWRMHMEYPDAPLNSHCHIEGNKCLSTTLEKKILERAKKDILRVYPTADKINLNRICYAIADELHTMTVLDLEEHACMLDALDFLQIYLDEEIQGIRKQIFDSPNKHTVNRIYHEIDNILRTEERYKNNPIAISLTQGTAKKGQLLQIIAFRGFCSELNQRIFPNIIPYGFMDGLTRLSFFGMESRSASIALHSQDTPVRDTEYCNRELQLMNYGIAEIDFHDCGTDEYVQWEVTKSDLDNILPGKFYKTEDGDIRSISKKDKFLVGQRIRLRTPAYCHHPDEGVICKYCLGEISESFQRDSNVQYQATVTQNEISTQSTISVKHLLMSAESDEYQIDPYYHDYLDNTVDSREIILSSKLWRHNELELCISSNDILQLADIYQGNITNKDISYYSSIRTIQIGYKDSITGERHVQEIPLNHGSSTPSISHALLQYMAEHKWIEEEGDKNRYSAIIIDLSRWEDGEILFCYPERRTTILEFVNSLKSKIFFTKTKKEEMTPEKAESMNFLGWNLRKPKRLYQVLRFFANEMNRKFKVSLPIVELVVLSMMTRNPKEMDYRLPTHDSEIWLSPQTHIMGKRSFSAKSAYEKQKEMLLNPTNYLDNPTSYHPFDELILPIGVSRNKWRKRPANTYTGRVLLPRKK